MTPGAHIPAGAPRGAGRRPARARIGAGVGAALALATLLADPAVAFERAGVLDQRTVEACLTIPRDRADLTARLVRLGWQPSTAAELPAELQQALALYFTAQHVYDRAPDIRLQSAWERAQKNVAGLTRLAASGGPRYFTSPDGSLLRIGHDRDPLLLGVYCTVILTPADAAETLAGLRATIGAAATLPPFKALPHETVAGSDARRGFRLTLLNRDALRERLGITPTVALVVETTLETTPPPQ